MEENTDNNEDQTNRQVADHANAKHTRTPKTESTDPKTDVVSGGPGGNILQRIWQWALAHKRISIPVAAVVLVVLLLIIPFTRYAILGTFLKQDYNVTVIDRDSQKPVTSATVSFHGHTVKTDNKGKATLHVPVGSGQLGIVKNYYKSLAADVTITISKPKPATYLLTATGRQVPVTVVNKISGLPVSKATVLAGGSQVQTDDKGEATIVLPASKTQVDGQVKLSGYNTAKVTVKVTTDKDTANTFAITPSGTLYILSDSSGKLDVVKADLDGQNRKTVLAGTGNEDKPNTILLASRDWQHIALLSKRDGGEHAKLFLIDTDTDQLTTMDEGNADFTPVGWSGSRFVYQVNRAGGAPTDANKYALKSYDANAKKITLLDQTAAANTDGNGYQAQTIANAYIFDQEVVYTKNWSDVRTYYYVIAPQNRFGNQATLNSIQSDGSAKKVVKAYDLATSNNEIYLGSKPGDLNEIYLSHYDDSGKFLADSYEDGKVNTSNMTSDQYYNLTYNTYLVSPSGKKTFWTEYRDGKNRFFVGDENGKNGKQLVGATNDFTSYGWYTDNYLLLTKTGSEMYIMPVDGLKGGVEASLKVSDYFKPNYSNAGYGYGYGG